jgi:hypothetical protein
MITTKRTVEFARWLDEIAPGFLITVISAETGEKFQGRDLLDQVARVIEIFGVAGAAKIVGCC